jgi:Uma2 family endonuclease
MTAPLKSSKPKALAQPPRTAMEVYEYLPEDTRSEVIDNVLYMPPTPSFEHQDISLGLAMSIRLYTEKNKLGKCVVAPLSVYLDHENVVEPDIIFIKTEHLGIIKKGKIRGTPNMLVELLSPGNRKHDLVTKLELYQRFAVPEYIIIDPLTKEVRHYVLENATYKQLPAEKGTFHSQVLKSAFSF